MSSGHLLKALGGLLATGTKPLEEMCYPARCHVLHLPEIQNLGMPRAEPGPAALVLPEP